MLVTKNFKDLTGQKFGHLTVIQRVPSIKSKGGKSQTAYLTKCLCGKEKVHIRTRLMNGHANTCGKLACIKKYKNREPEIHKHTNWYCDCTSSCNALKPVEIDKEECCVKCGNYAYYSSRPLQGKSWKIAHIYTNDSSCGYIEQYDGAVNNINLKSISHREFIPVVGKL